MNTLSPFTSKNEKSYPDMFWELVRDLPTNSIIAHNDPRLDFAITDHYQVVKHIARRMEKEQRRTLASIRGEGYKIVAGVDQTALARRDLRGAQKKARRAGHRASTIDTREMTGAEQQEAAEMLTRTDFLVRAADHSSRKISRAGR